MDDWDYPEMIKTMVFPAACIVWGIYSMINYGHTLYMPTYFYILGILGGIISGFLIGKFNEDMSDIFKQRVLTFVLVFGIKFVVGGLMSWIDAFLADLIIHYNSVYLDSVVFAACSLVPVLVCVFVYCSNVLTTPRQYALAIFSDPNTYIAGVELLKMIGRI